jgi:hypothetical protein
LLCSLTFVGLQPAQVCHCLHRRLARIPQFLQTRLDGASRLGEFLQDDVQDMAGHEVDAPDDLPLRIGPLTFCPT